MADYGFFVLVLWEIILTAFAALVFFRGWKGMVLCCVLLLAGSLVTMEEAGRPWIMMAVCLGMLALGLGLEAWLKQKSDVQGLVRMEAGVLGMMLLLALGWAMLPVALFAGALCGGLILRRYIFVPGIPRKLVVLGIERVVLALAWLVLGNLI